MTKLMIILLTFLMLISPIYGQTTNNLLESLTLLEQELLISRQHSKNLSEKIISLKKLLTEAQKLPERQKKRIELLQQELAGLLKSLETSKQTVKANEKKYEAAVKEIKAAHMADILQAQVNGCLNFGAGVLIGAGVVAAAILLK